MTAGTARCGPACRGGVGAGTGLLGQSPATRFESSVLPVVRVAMKMHDRNDRNDIWLDSEQDTEGKDLGETATDIPFDKRVEFGIHLDLVEGVLNCCEKSLPEVFLP